MSFDPNLMTTTHGSLPYTTPSEAVEAVLKFTPEIPTWPQLPKLGFRHNMMAQVAHDMPGVRIDESAKHITFNKNRVAIAEMEAYYMMLLQENADAFPAEEDYFPGLYELGRHVKELKAAQAVKGQICGPVTLGLQMMDAQEKSVLFEQADMEIILKTLKMKARWQSNYLKERNPNVLLFVDEPSLTLMGSPCVPLDKEIVISYVNEILGGPSGLKGLHCCGNTDWPALMETSTDILSFDAYNLFETIVLFPSEIESFISRGGKLAWGIVPTRDDRIEKEDVDSIIRRLQEQMRQLVDKGIKMDDLVRSTFITPACGLGLSSPENAVKALEMTREVSRRMRSEHGLEG